MENSLGEVVKDYLRKFPTLPSLTIAKQILDKHPEFESTERIRSSIRYYRGANGAWSAANVGTEEFLTQPYGLPTPDVYDSTPFVIPEKCGLLLSDLHFPFQDNTAIKSVLDWAKEQKKNHPLDFILLNGDVVDFYQLSSYLRDPKQRIVADEIAAVEDFFQTLKDEFPEVKVYYKEANHERRFDKYLYQCAEEFAGIKEFTLENILHLKQYGIEFIKNKRVIKFGHLNIIHGDEFQRGMSNPVNPARTIFLKAKESTICGHSHVTSEHSGRTIGRELITCWSTGCLCQLNPEYAPLNDWNHGFAFLSRENGLFRVVNLRIEDGVVY